MRTQHRTYASLGRYILHLSVTYPGAKSAWQEWDSIVTPERMTSWPPLPLVTILKPKVVQFGQQDFFKNIASIPSSHTITWGLSSAKLHSQQTKFMSIFPQGMEIESLNVQRIALRVTSSVPRLYQPDAPQHPNLPTLGSACHNPPLLIGSSVVFWWIIEDTFLLIAKRTHFENRKKKEVKTVIHNPPNKPNSFYFVLYQALFTHANVLYLMTARVLFCVLWLHLAVRPKHSSRCYSLLAILIAA